MPEAPDLVVIREFLLPRLIGNTITGASERKPLVLRNMLGVDFETDIAGRTIERLDRQGKLLIIGLSDSREIVISPMLTGALMWCDPSERMLASKILVFELESGDQLRYLDQKKMGQVYYIEPSQQSEIVRLENQGADVIDEPLNYEQFVEGLRPYRGEIKGILTRGELVSGIGNAYADEILHDAGVYPFRKVGRLTDEEKLAIHASIYSVPKHAIEVLRERVGDDIHRKVRDFLNVHGKKNEKCPRCSSKITMITANKRETSYCRTCQPGSLFE